jgi:hypothetical protein
MISPSITVSSGSFSSATAIAAKTFVKSLPLRDSNRTFPSVFIAERLSSYDQAGPSGSFVTAKSEHRFDESDPNFLGLHFPFDSGRVRGFCAGEISKEG